MRINGAGDAAAATAATAASATATATAAAFVRYNCYFLLYILIRSTCCCSLLPVLRRQYGQSPIPDSKQGGGRRQCVYTGFPVVTRFTRNLSGVPKKSLMKTKANTLYPTERLFLGGGGG